MYLACLLPPSKLNKFIFWVTLHGTQHNLYKCKDIKDMVVQKGIKRQFT